MKDSVLSDEERKAVEVLFKDFCNSFPLSLFSKGDLKVAMFECAEFTTKILKEKHDAEILNENAKNNIVQSGMLTEINCLQSEITQLKAEIKTLNEGYDRESIRRAEIFNQLRESLAREEACVDFYANKDNWNGPGKYNDRIPLCDVAEYHGGFMARQTVAKRGER